MQKQDQQEDDTSINANAIGSRARSLTLSTKLFPSRQPPRCLPTAVFGSVRVEGFRHKEILSFGSAYTEVVGTEPEDGVYETLALSVVEKFNLLDVVTCDRIVARLTSRFPGVAQRWLRYAAGNFRRADRQPVRRAAHRQPLFERLELAPDYFCEPEQASWTGLLKAAENDRDGGLSVLSLPGANGDPVPLPTVEQKATLLGFCIAVRDPKPGAELGHPVRIKVPQFGTVHLGEFFAAPPHAA